MAPGATTLSGAFGITDTAGIESFIETIITASTSGAVVFTYPVGAGQQVYIGVAEGRG